MHRRHYASQPHLVSHDSCRAKGCGLHASVTRVVATLLRTLSVSASHVVSWVGLASWGDSCVGHFASHLGGFMGVRHHLGCARFGWESASPMSASAPIALLCFVGGFIGYDGHGHLAWFAVGGWSCLSLLCFKLAFYVRAFLVTVAKLEFWVFVVVFDLVIAKRIDLTPNMSSLDMLMVMY
jgi:hypothetical protein